jgi:hypothetical protein
MIAKALVKGLLPPMAWDLTRKMKGKAKAPPERLFDGDDAMFRRVVDEARVYGEYGVGASTNYIYDHTDAYIMAVETSPEWAARTIENKDRSRISIACADVGPVGAWGRPLSYALCANSKLYRWHLEPAVEAGRRSGRWTVPRSLLLDEPSPGGRWNSDPL